MFSFALLCVLSSFAIILMRKSFAFCVSLVSSDCYVAFANDAVSCNAMPRCVIVVFPDDTHFLFTIKVNGRIDIR